MNPQLIQDLSVDFTEKMRNFAFFNFTLEVIEGLLPLEFEAWGNFRGNCINYFHPMEP
jgi:hypothetical protein